MDTLLVTDLINLHLHLTLCNVLQNSETIVMLNFVSHCFQVGLVDTASRLTQED